ncbi:MAG: hypothetical protein JAY90_11575 [Candidatus Thiodiazotropha lotti]|nr:hypothetical protein [Candidatus Thiodiazotropha lotti]
MAKKELASDMKELCYINLEQARQVLSGMGVELTTRQIKRAAEPDAHGRRKLPFFIDPIEGRLKIEKGTLIDIYRKAQINAERGIRE